jgi:hypothetical protein
VAEGAGPDSLPEAVSTFVRVFSPQFAPAHPLSPPDYPPNRPFPPPPYPLTAKNRPFCPPPPYPLDRPPPQPSLDGIAETVCITPFALYYAP